ncbi:MAG: hypothetical protein ACE5JD_05985 [Candidatus Methylomirabilia bacterium]
MSRMDQLLREELQQVLDRVSATAGGGTVAFVSVHHPVLRGRLDEADQRLAAIRTELLDRYSAWMATLKEIEALWELAAWEARQLGAAEALEEAA